MAAIGGIVTFFGGIIGGISDGSFGPVIGGFIGGPLVFIFGALGARIYSELLILIFQINDSLTDIEYALKKEEPPAE